MLRTVTTLRRYDGGQGTPKKRLAPPWSSVTWGEPLVPSAAASSAHPEEAVWFALEPLRQIPDPVDLAERLPEPRLIGERWLLLPAPLREPRSLLHWFGGSTVVVPRVVRGSALLLRGYRHVGGVATETGWDLVWGLGSGD